MRKITINGRSYALVAEAPTTLKRTRVSQAQFDGFLANGMERSLADTLFEVRAKGSRISRNIKCPQYGTPEHWRGAFVTSTDADVAAGRCGRTHDGLFSAEGWKYHESILVPAKAH